MVSSFKLTYFDARGRGEVIRWIFSYAEQPFGDKRVDHAQWPAMKPNTPFGQIPVLEVDGKQLAQSHTIERFLARKFGLAGENTWDEAQADAIVDFITDARNGMMPYRQAIFAKNQAAAETAKAEYLRTTVGPHLDKLETLVKPNDNGQGGFFIGSKPTWADFTVATFCDELLRMKNTALDGHSYLKAHNNRVHELKGIKEWLAKRPETAL